MFWFDKDNENVLFMDNRQLEDTLCDGRKLIIKLDIVADFRLGLGLRKVYVEFTEGVKI